MVKDALRDPRISQDGAAWLAKALHPADVTLDVHGVPTLEGVPTATLDFMTTTTIAAPSAAAWTAEILLNPTPLYFGKVITSTATPTYGTQTLYNPALVPSTPYAEFGNAAQNWHANADYFWRSNVIRHRLLYASVTVTMSATTQTNEGTVVCAQYPKTYTKGFSTIFMDETQPTTALYTGRQIAFANILRPNATALQALKGSVAWDAKEGVYMVLKIDEGGLKWQDTGKQYMMLGLAGFINSSDCALKQGKDAQDFYTPAAAWQYDTPFGPQGTWSRQVPAGTGATTTTPINGCAVGVSTNVVHYLPTCLNMGHILFQGLDPQCSLMVTMRVGYEIVVPPGSSWAQNVTQPVLYDSVALESYYRHSREMLSAYPAKYNIFGAILPFLKKAGEFILPTVGKLVGSLFNKKDEASPPNATTSGRTLNLVAPPPPVVYAPPPVQYPPPNYPPPQTWVPARKPKMKRKPRPRAPAPQPARYQQLPGGRRLVIQRRR